jgi:mevalonate kinase
LGGLEPILAALAQCEAVSEAAAQASPGLLTPAVWKAKQHCAKYAVASRTSGAGGGDCVLAVGRSAAVAAAARAWHEGHGAVVAMLPADLAAATVAVGGRE